MVWVCFKVLYFHETYQGIQGSTNSRVSLLWERSSKDAQLLLLVPTVTNSSVLSTRNKTSCLTQVRINFGSELGQNFSCCQLLTQAPASTNLQALGASPVALVGLICALVFTGGGTNPASTPVKAPGALSRQLPRHARHQASRETRLVSLPQGLWTACPQCCGGSHRAGQHFFGTRELLWIPRGERTPPALSRTRSSG